jgi:hypothetical protein
MFGLEEHFHVVVGEILKFFRCLIELAWAFAQFV